ncbi:TetR/AcrR family transcriptional regulator [Actinophytocola gossypii]|uniref:TetR/AcrR family transcriptional regulator n=1 Tax=Actinophytocola gossypii TaxID=2812003 RepID=A0ABT2J2J5_9PSEU|nr:TetR/AcrR family transcriptional regulator [Actinophytocola gossypii]MCT2582075.1 TetR/AcrR family transcriptional regulator [Actinophytocola gossypii]
MSARYGDSVGLREVPMATGTVGDVVPPRGTRPRNRRALIIAAATDLFHQNGYEQVSMSDVADAVNVRPSALYRHFAGKPQLLVATIVEEMRPFREVFTDPTVDGIDDVPERLATAALDRRLLGELWQREARSLPDDEYAVLRAEVTTTIGMLAEVVRRSRPELPPVVADLLAQCACSVLSAVSQRNAALPKMVHGSVLRALLHQVLHAPQATAADHEPGPGRFAPVARRERVLAAAISLFAARGFVSVSMDDIGARAGIAGPSVYHHFESKQSLLEAAFTRGNEWLRHDLHRALAKAVDTRDALRRLLSSYVDFTMENSEQVDLLVTEQRHLAADVRDRIRQAQREYIGEWLHLLGECSSGMSAEEAKIRVHAVTTMVNDVARTRHLRDHPATVETVRRLGRTMLLSPGEHGAQVAGSTATG